MIEEQNYLTIINAWEELNKINNNIDLIETLIESRKSIQASKIKETVVSGGYLTADKMLNTIINNDDDSLKLKELYKSRAAYELYIYNEIERLRLNDREVAVAFLKDYKNLKWSEIAEIIHYSIKQCERYYSNYKSKYKTNNVAKCRN